MMDGWWDGRKNEGWMDGGMGERMNDGWMVGWEKE